MKRKTFYLGDGERVCVHLDKTAFEFLETASSGRAAPSKNELFRRCLWKAGWIIEEKGIDALIEFGERIRNGENVGPVGEGSPLTFRDWFEMTMEAPWIELDDIPEPEDLQPKILNEKLPVLGIFVVVLSGYMKNGSRNKLMRDLRQL